MRNRKHEHWRVVFTAERPERELQIDGRKLSIFVLVKERECLQNQNHRPTSNLLVLLILLCREWLGHIAKLLFCFVLFKTATPHAVKLVKTKRRNGSAGLA